MKMGEATTGENWKEKEERGQIREKFKEEKETDERGKIKAERRVRSKHWLIMIRAKI
jgi:hypothetical protein